MKHLDWDILFIFDAMRWAEGSAILPNYFEGALEKIDTQVSTTAAWYKKYWGIPNDVNLISSNPQPWHKNSGYIYKNFKTAHIGFTNNWLKVNPKATLDLFVGLYEPAEKYLVHLMPPHLPYVFGKGAKFISGLQYNQKNIYATIQDWGLANGFDPLKGYYQEQIVGIANLLLAYLPNIPTDKKVVISSDHGELIGFNGVQYDHPPTPTPEQSVLLHNVPWLEVNLLDTLIEQRLKLLGYV